MNSIDLALIGNCTVSALVDSHASIVWACLPRFDGDAVFCSLLNPKTDEPMAGCFAIDVVDRERTEQVYAENTAVLVTRVHDRHGGCVEISDFAPRFHQFGRTYRPSMLVRRITRIAGSPRIALHIRPLGNYGAAAPTITWGSNHVRYIMPDQVLRLSTTAPITAVLDGSVFFLDEQITLVLGPDESIHEPLSDLGRRFQDQTVHYWCEWVRALGIPLEWQEETIRAAITLKLNAYDDTGAIVAAMTTSVPEAEHTTRNWDYRFCWLRDSYFVVNALNRLGATHTMERYLAYILNVSANNSGGLQPVYAIDGKSRLIEREISSLQGYRGMGPVRVGNQAWQQVQHDAYGSAILSATHVFFDLRLSRRGDKALFNLLEPLGEMAATVYDQPDAGIWELRGRSRVHTFSAAMCWAACDRLALIANRLGLQERCQYWRARADSMHATITARTWNRSRATFASTFDGDGMDASLLLLAEIGFVDAADPCFSATVDAVERDLRRGDFIFRYVEEDDFGTPQNAFIVCTFWYINALASIGRRDEARALFEKLLGYRNRLGLFAEHIDPRTGEQWGNFVQTYSMVGVINSAIRSSKRWDQAF